MLLAFRYVSDPRLALPGWWIDDIRLGRSLLADGGSLAGWRSFSQVTREVGTAAFTVQLVGYSTSGRRAFVQRLRLDGQGRGSLAGAALRRLLAPGYDVVAAIVTHDDPTEAKRVYGRYVLRVNGTVQRGGR